jgi:membrane protease YdiL (CAAX protease family)
MRWFPVDGFAWRTLAFAAGFELGLGVIAGLVGWPLGIDVLETARFSWKAVAAGAVATIPMLLALVCMLRWPVGPLAGLVEKMRHFTQNFLSPCGIIGLACISISAGVGEEVLTRGFIHTLALRHMPQIPALIATGLVFGLMHPISRAYITIAAIIGVYLGLVWMLSPAGAGSGPDLAAPVTAHALYDFVALMVLSKSRERRVPQVLD